MKDKNLFLARLDNEPTLISPDCRSWFETAIKSADEHLSQLGARLSEEGAPQMRDDFWPEEGTWLAYVRPYTVVDGVLQIPVRGALLKDFPYAASFATGYEYIWEAFTRGVEDSEVRAIALNIDSPGGMVAGCFDLVDKMYAVRDAKPVRAFANEHAYSAAYAIASVAQDGITVGRTGGVGSVGVVTMHVDMSKMLDNAGVKITYIHAGKHKVEGNPFEELPDDVKARIQGRIDALYDEFVSTVARNRSMDEKAIRATEALTFTAKEAVSNGMADAIGSFDDAVAAFAAETSNNEGDVAMSSQTDNENAAVETAAVDEARKAGFDQGMTEGRAEGVQAERARINAILGCDAAKTRQSSALAAALKTDMSVEQAESFLADLPEDPKATPPQQQPKGAGAGDDAFNRAMENTDNPSVGAEGNDEGSDESGELSDHELAKSWGLPGIKTA